VQHYEVPAGFFVRVLGPRLKYSCCYWPHPETTLAEAEEEMAGLFQSEEAVLHEVVDGAELKLLGLAELDGLGCRTRSWRGGKP
jgi:cyclopropane-fatty-acyl-phospholipid synthase